MSIIFRPGLDFREAAGGLGRPWAKDAVNPGGEKEDDHLGGCRDMDIPIALTIFATITDLVFF